MTEREAKNRLVGWCNSQLGNHEGANNWNRYAANTELQRWYGSNPQNQPWCDIFTDAGFLECFGLEKAAAMTYQPVGQGSALCRTSAQFFKSNGAWYSRPEVGDVVFFCVSGDINHQGIVVSVDGSSFTTIEGNSSDTVARRVYTIGSPTVAGFGRPKWSVVVDDSGPAEDEGHAVVIDHTGSTTTGGGVDLPVLRMGSKGEAVRAAQLLLIGRGFRCGAWGADGDFGSATHKAACRFQTDRSLTADGIIGRDTWSELLGL